MSESELLEKWESEKPIYKEWGDFIVSEISRQLESQEKDLQSFFKVIPKPRLKENSSLVDKAYYRANKSYSDPYSQIEDKVGVRFVVLLLNDIQCICDIINSSELWNFDPCKHFEADKKKEPLLFTYQSVHYILRPKKDIEINGVKISTLISCEVQVRTLLQHAHAELTHDSVYKAKRSVQPDVHRTIAKSMALIETTDSFFMDVTKNLNAGPLEDFNILGRLNSIYELFTGLNPHSTKFTLTIWDAFEQLISPNLVDDISKFLEQPAYVHLSEVIKSRYIGNTLYQQGVILFLYWMLVNRKQRLLRDWPFQRDLLQPMANDLGISTWDE